VLNWPNFLTALRILCAPVFVFFLLAPSAGARTVATAIFVAAAVTDFVDGYLARKLRCGTDFGKFLDPIADKVLVISALVCLAWMRRIPLWMVLAVVARDLIIMGFRGVAASRGIYIFPSALARLKTMLLMAAVVAVLVELIWPYWSRGAAAEEVGAAVAFVAAVTLWVAVVLTLATGVWYLWKNRQVLVTIFVR
jgi:CDP-diacylglycerol--glycerol-3-phosphate 3-phosphatidyltransferase